MSSCLTVPSGGHLVIMITRREDNILSYSWFDGMLQRFGILKRNRIYRYHDDCNKVDSATEMTLYLAWNADEKRGKFSKTARFTNHPRLARAFFVPGISIGRCDAPMCCRVKVVFLVRRAESFVQNRACTEPHWAAAGTSNPRMTVAAASATLVAHFGRPRYMSAVFDCIPRASTCETALEKRRAECIAQYCVKTRAAREQLRQGRRGSGVRNYRRRPVRIKSEKEEDSWRHNQRSMIIKISQQANFRPLPFALDPS